MAKAQPFPRHCQDHHKHAHRPHYLCTRRHIPTASPLDSVLAEKSKKKKKKKKKSGVKADGDGQGATIPSSLPGSSQASVPSASRDQPESKATHSKSGHSEKMGLLFSPSAARSEGDVNATVGDESSKGAEAAAADEGNETTWTTEGHVINPLDDDAWATNWVEDRVGDPDQVKRGGSKAPVNAHSLWLFVTHCLWSFVTHCLWSFVIARTIGSVVGCGRSNTHSCIHILRKHSRMYLHVHMYHTHARTHTHTHAHTHTHTHTHTQLYAGGIGGEPSRTAAARDPKPSEVQPKRRKVRSKQKNLRKDTRPEHLKPTSPVKKLPKPVVPPG